MREYELWIERDRTLHRERRVGALARANFAGQRILEIGSGFGSNLLTLQTVASEAVGLEMEPVALQLAPLLARREGVPAPRIVQGVAERMPFDDASFDTVMAFGSLQYMSIPLALREAARVLRPGGRLLAVLSSWRQFVGCSRDRLRRARRPGPVIDALCAGVNMLFYQHANATGPVLKRRSVMNNFVYPTHSGMRRLLRRAGLRPAEGPFTMIDHETVYEANRA
jgi:ubiquinone/menaquinone biosynthesis C-methylase UbiE